MTKIGKACMGIITYQMQVFYGAHVYQEMNGLRFLPGSKYWADYQEEVFGNDIGGEFPIYGEDEIMPDIYANVRFRGKVCGEEGARCVEVGEPMNNSDESFSGYFAYVLAFLLDNQEIRLRGDNELEKSVPFGYVDLCDYRNYLQAKYPQVYFPPLEGWQDEREDCLLKDLNDALNELGFEYCALFELVD